MIRVQELRRAFDTVQALDGMSFEVPSGVICGFVGPNGAGKSTTMRILATLDLPDSGRAEVGGIDVVGDPHAVRRQIGFMPDNAGVIEHVLVSEYLEFFARARGLRGAERRSEQARIAEFTGLTRLMDRPVSGLSKGELQRLSLSRALFGSPSLLILDEPAAGLDPRARVELRELLKVLVKSMNTTVLISSHILSELQNMVDRVVVVQEGQVVFQGTLDALKGEGDAAVGPRFVLEPIDDHRPAVRQWLLEQPSVRGVQARDDDLLVDLDEADEPAHDLVARAIMEGHRFRQFYRKQTDLEGLYMQIVKPHAGAPDA